MTYSRKILINISLFHLSRPKSLFHTRMRAELKQLHSPDIDLTIFWPEDAHMFHFLLQAMIGPENQNSSESFDFEVCTPNWIAKHRTNIGPCFGKNLLIVENYDINAIENRLRGLCRNTTGMTWNEIAAKLGRYGKWEFEDYREA